MYPSTFLFEYLYSFLSTTSEYSRPTLGIYEYILYYGIAFILLIYQTVFALH